MALGAITAGLGLAKKVAEAAAIIAEQSRNQQLIDAGMATQMADSARALYEALKKINEARDAFGLDPEYTERVEDATTRKE